MLRIPAAWGFFCTLTPCTKWKNTTFPPARLEEKSTDTALKNPLNKGILREKEKSTIIIVGLQTDYCIDATIKAGFEHGFKMIVPSNTNSTFDNKYMSAEQTYSYYNEFMWNRRYAECISFEKALELMGWQISDFLRVESCVLFEFS